MAEKVISLRLLVDSNQAEVKIDHVNDELQQASDNAKQTGKSFDESTKNLNKNMKSVEQGAGLAGASVISFGQVLSDLPYGIRGVANNLSQLSTLMVSLVATTGSVRGAVIALRTAFMGPLGLLVGIQGILGALEIFSMRSQKAKREQEELAKAQDKSAKATARENEERKRLNVTLKEQEAYLKSIKNLKNEELALEKLRAEQDLKTIQREKEITQALFEQAQFEVTRLAAIGKGGGVKELEYRNELFENLKRYNEEEERTLEIIKEIGEIQSDRLPEQGEDTRIKQAEESLERLKSIMQEIDETINRGTYAPSRFFSNFLPTKEEWDEVVSDARIATEKIVIYKREAATTPDVVKWGEVYSDEFNTIADGLSALGNLFMSFNKGNEERAKKNFEISKALNIATAIIDTYLSANKAFLSQMTLTPDAPIRGAIAAAAATVAGLARVNAIKNTKFNSRNVQDTPNGSNNIPQAERSFNSQEFGSLSVAPSGSRLGDRETVIMVSEYEVYETSQRRQRRRAGVTL